MQKGTFYYEIVGTLYNVFEKTYFKDLIFNKIETKSEEFYYNVIFARSINVLFSIGNIILIYFLSILLFRKKLIGILAAFNYSIFAQEIAFNSVLSGDITLSFFTLATLYFATKAFNQNKPEKLWIAGLFSGFATATKFTGIFTIIPIIASFFFLNKEKLTKRIKIIPKILISFTAGLIVGMPSIIFKFNTFIEGIKLQKYYQTGAFLPGEDQLPRFIFYFSNVFKNGLGLVFITLIGTGIIYFAYSRKKEKTIWIILSWISVYYLVLSLSSWITHRYTMPLMPIFAIMAAYLIWHLYKKFQNKKIALLIIILLYSYNLLFLYNFMATIVQSEARAQFYEYEKETLKLDKNNPEITFIVSRLENTNHPTNIDYPANVLLIGTIKKNPQIEISTKYILFAENQIMDYLRLKDPAITDFFKNIQNKYKLIKVFKKDNPLPFFYNDKTYFMTDLELLMKKYYLYEKHPTLETTP